MALQGRCPNKVIAYVEALQNLSFHMTKIDQNQILSLGCDHLDENYENHNFRDMWLIWESSLSLFPY